MAMGDHWDEPARCHKCGQERSTHDDGECAGVIRSMSQASIKFQPIQRPPNWQQIADRLYEVSIYCRKPMTVQEWKWVAETLVGLEDMVKLEIWILEQRENAI